MAGTGRVNAALGAVMTMQGVGAALSTTLGGAVAEGFGYSMSFVALGGVALIALSLWWFATPLMSKACVSGLPLPQPT
jgi:predicted MFS family arabinose efflux permease